MILRQKKSIKRPKKNEKNKKRGKKTIWRRKRRIKKREENMAKITKYGKVHKMEENKATTLSPCSPICGFVALGVKNRSYF